jgi:hypothetical protein
MKDIFKRRFSEASSLYGIAVAILGVLLAFGVPITPGQISAILILLGALLGVTPDRQHTNL